MTDKDGNLLWFGSYTGWGRLKEETKVTLQAVDRLRRRGCAGRRAAHGGAQCTADAAGGIPGALYLSGSAGRTGRRRGGTAARDDDRAGGRPPAPRRSGRMARRERIRAGGFRLRAG